MNFRFKHISSNGLLAVLFFIWWVLNLIQSSFTGLADDEAYYWYYASQLDWGYFDHPPVTALLVRLGSFLGGALGIRFFITMLQPLALYLFWTLIRPENPSRKDVWLYVVICFSLPVAQIYGFIASPDSPLMFSVAVFFCAYSRFTRKDTIWNALLLGFSLALMAYSKYHGALVVIFTLLSNPKLLRNPKFYLSGLFALLLFLPHLVWQYQHDWASFRYHLVGRNGLFQFSNLTDFLANLLLVFNPFFLWIYLKGWGKGAYADEPLQRALYFNVAGFPLFFMCTVFRGYVQPQWTLPIAWGLIMICFGWTRKREKVKRYVFRVGMVMAFLFILTRIAVIFNPLGIKYELFDNEESYGEIYDVSDGRPVIWYGSYAQASKYRYYTGGECYAQPDLKFRSSQWQFDTCDRNFIGRDVLVEQPYELLDSTCGHLKMKNGTDFIYKEVKNFHPVREVAISVSGKHLPKCVRCGEMIETELTLDNPYPYDIIVDSELTTLEYFVKRQHGRYDEYNVCPSGLTIPANGTAVVKISFTIPDNFRDEMADGTDAHSMDYRTGFVLKYGPTPLCIQSEMIMMTICH